ncbi:AIM32 [Candida jiufengensis]|uniref:AIM32 n=1 Tax=Candida jiufengensis TaxID=497108 RepID=UPI002224BD33|nr:AIM32 [Candida jiufengensis]KAI5952575.1 AIM32 [Candida jiufengensis]
MAPTIDNHKMNQFDFKIVNMPGTLAHKIHELKSKLVMKPGVSELQKKNNENDITVDDSNFEEIPICKDLIVTCGYAKRDIRSGELGPFITKEFDQVLKSKGLADETHLGEITHVGGHALAGNVLYYCKQSNSSRGFIWYGRVFPQMVQSFDDTIINKSNVKELFRGNVSKYE